MATYRGKIELIDMREIAQAGTLFTWIRYADDIEGNGISSSPEGKYYIGIAYNKTSPNPSNNPKDYTWTLFKGESGISLLEQETFYAISDNGVIPPVDTTKFSLSENGELTFTENGVVYLVINKDFLSARDYNENIQKFNITNNYLSGVGEEWTKDIPEVPKGYYLWTKTVYYYSDGTSTVQFLNSYQGKDGEDFNQFKLQFNQTEILKFAKKDEDGLEITTISPERLVISVIKEDIYNPEKQQQITNLDINNFSVWIYNIKTGEWTQIDNSLASLGESIITIDELFKFNINLEQMLKEGQINNQNIFNLFLTEECILRTSYAIQEMDELGTIKNHVLNEFINVRFGMNRDMASLSVNANGIVAAMQDSQLVFNGDGLTVKNGSFSIQNSEEDRKLYMDTDGNLALAGNIYAENGYFRGELQGATGSFTGKITATEGSFSGQINANSGDIGGFNIRTDSLFSKHTDENNEPTIILNGTTGEIKANNITLGIGAKIDNYIKIGDNVELKRPVSTSDYFIKVENDGYEVLSLTADGTIQVGNNEKTIIINGAEGYIMSQNFFDGMGWKISNAESIFNDVTVKGSIKASVFEYGETQAIGGAILVRPSSRIISAQINQEEGVTTLFLESTTGFFTEDRCKIGDESEYYIITEVDQIENIIKIRTPLSDISGKVIVNFGHLIYNEETKESEVPIGISINGSTDNSFTPSGAITVFEFKEEELEDQQIERRLIPRVILGKLPSSKEEYGFAAGTYGLFAENAYLRGSLVTQTKGLSNGQVAYSGISTLYQDGISPNSANTEVGLNFSNPGEILLWAGAPGDTPEDIEKSSFFVDRNGNLFAGSGYFKGTIITDATITASAIETAKIKGWGEKPALTIEDATKGIVFNAIDESGESFSVFEVTKDYITANVPSFNFNNNFSINDKGSLIVPNLYITGAEISTIADEDKKEVIMFDKHKISYGTNFIKEELIGTINRYIDFSNGLAFSTNGSTNIFELTDSRVRAKAELYLDGSIQYGEKMKYEPVYNIDNILIGYDLYVE